MTVTSCGLHLCLSSTIHSVSCVRIEGSDLIPPSPHTRFVGGIDPVIQLSPADNLGMEVMSDRNANVLDRTPIVLMTNAKLIMKYLSVSCFSYSISTKERLPGSPSGMPSAGELSVSESLGVIFLGTSSILGLRNLGFSVFLSRLLTSTLNHHFSVIASLLKLCLEGEPSVIVRGGSISPFKVLQFCVQLRAYGFSKSIIAFMVYSKRCQVTFNSPRS